MEFRKVFDTVPEQFDRYRPRYSPELFSELIAYAGIGPGKCVLELGPGTGQATEPILNTGCDYHAIELGEHLYAMMIRKYGDYPNFHIVNDDFITHDFGVQKFDVIYSAATIQWIPEEIAFSKTFDLLKPGGTLAMMLTKGDYRTPNEELYHRIQQVYSKYYKPETEYKHGAFGYTNARRLPRRRTLPRPPCGGSPCRGPAKRFGRRAACARRPHARRRWNRFRDCSARHSFCISSEIAP